jgi:hypothetical protein
LYKPKGAIKVKKLETAKLQFEMWVEISKNYKITAQFPEDIKTQLLQLEKARSSLTKIISVQLQYLPEKMRKQYNNPTELHIVEGGGRRRRRPPKVVTERGAKRFFAPQPPKKPSEKKFLVGILEKEPLLKTKFLPGFFQTRKKQLPLPVSPTRITTKTPYQVGDFLEFPYESIVTINGIFVGYIKERILVFNTELLKTKVVSSYSEIQLISSWTQNSNDLLKYSKKMNIGRDIFIERELFHIGDRIALKTKRTKQMEGIVLQAGDEGMMVGNPSGLYFINYTTKGITKKEKEKPQFKPLKARKTRGKEITYVGQIFKMVNGPVEKAHRTLLLKLLQESITKLCGESMVISPIATGYLLTPQINLRLMSYPEYIKREFRIYKAAQIKKIAVLTKADKEQLKREAALLSGEGYKNELAKIEKKLQSAKNVPVNEEERSKIQKQITENLQEELAHLKYYSEVLDIMRQEKPGMNYLNFLLLHKKGSGMHLVKKFNLKMKKMRDDMTIKQLESIIKKTKEKLKEEPDEKKVETLTSNIHNLETFVFALRLGFALSISGVPLPKELTELRDIYQSQKKKLDEKYETLMAQYNNLSMKERTTKEGFSLRVKLNIHKTAAEHIDVLIEEEKILRIKLGRLVEKRKELEKQYIKKGGLTEGEIQELEKRKYYYIQQLASKRYDFLSTILRSKYTIIFKRNYVDENNKVYEGLYEQLKRSTIKTEFEVELERKLEKQPYTDPQRAFTEYEVPDPTLVYPETKDQRAEAVLEFFKRKYAPLTSDRMVRVASDDAYEERFTGGDPTENVEILEQTDDDIVPYDAVEEEDIEKERTGAMAEMMKVTEIAEAQTAKARRPTSSAINPMLESEEGFIHYNGLKEKLEAEKQLNLLEKYLLSVLKERVEKQTKIITGKTFMVWLLNVLKGEDAQKHITGEMLDSGFEIIKTIKKIKKRKVENLNNFLARQASELN